MTDTVSRRRSTVLLIDDNPALLDLYAMVFQQHVDVITATRGEPGYALACAKRPDAVVVDVLLPDLDGLQICERLSADPVTASIPLIVLTADDRAFARAEATSHVDAVLRKPCRADELLDVVRRAMTVRAG